MRPAADRGTAVDRLSSLEEQLWRPSARWAIVVDDVQWRPHDVAARVELLAAQMRDAAGRDGAVVALECGRGVPSIFAFLAALRAGHTPLLGSAEDPPARRARLRLAAAADLVVADGPAGDWTVSKLPDGQRDGAAAIYLTTTSGTTGTPKIAAISPEVFATYAGDVRCAYGLTPGDRVLQFAPPGFDVFVEELLPTLAAGATLVVPPWSHAPAAGDFLDLVEAARVSVVNLPSSYWMAVAGHLRANGREVPESLRLVVIGSEPVARGLVDWWLAHAPDVRVVNAYGIAELAPTSFVFDCAELPSATSFPDVVPIGHPLPHVEASIGSHESAADLGQGRLCLTAGADVEGSPAQRFDTGDLATEADDGYFYLHGRADLTRLKRGGVTVNAETVAAAARECHGVVAALPRVDRKTGTLVLLVQPEGDDEGIVGRVEQHLRDVLPGSWLPDRVQAAGGASRPAGAKLTAAATAGAPVTADDAARAAWAAVLGPVTIDADTDFFDAGGDSLGAVRACSALSEALGVRVPVQLIFANPRFDAFVGGLGAVARSRETAPRADKDG